MANDYSFGFSNNAPPPVPSYGNPTGANVGGKGTGTVKASSSNFPSYPVFGPPTGSAAPATPSANNPANMGSGMADLKSGLPGVTGNQGLLDQLSKAYGGPAAYALMKIMGKGLFNPHVAQAFLDAMKPSTDRGVASIENAFGAEGARFGSSAALGVGDFLSQVNLNQNQVMAQMFEQAQSEELSILTGTLPTLHAEEANKGGFWDDILGGLEIAGGVAAEFIPGAQALGTGLISGGIGTLGKGLGGGSDSGSGGGDLAQLLQKLIKGQNSGSTDITEGGSMEIPGWDGGTAMANTVGSTITPPAIPQIAAGASLGGADPFNSNGSGGESDMQNQLMQLIMSGQVDPSQLMQILQGGMGNG